MAALVSARSASVTTTWSWSSVPCGHFSLSSLIPATPSIELGKAVMSVIPVRRDRTGEARRRRTATDSTVITTGRRMTRGHEAAPEAAPFLARRALVEPGERGSAPSADRPERERRGKTRQPGRRSPEVHPVAEDRQRRRQERQAPDDRHEDDRDRPDGHRREQRHAEGDQTGQRDHHRQPGEEDGPTGGAARDLDRLRPVAAGAPFDSEAGDHEQRVVDRDGEPDEDDELRRVRADRPDDLAVDAEDPECGHERGDRQDERHHRRHDRPEREQQDDERQRDRQRQGRVEAVADERVDVVVDERAADGVDGKRGMGRPGVVEDRQDRRDERRDPVLVAVDPTDDPDGRPVGGDEAGLRAAPRTDRRAG